MSRRVPQAPLSVHLASNRAAAASTLHKRRFAPRRDAADALQRLAAGGTHTLWRRTERGCCERRSNRGGAHASDCRRPPVTSAREQRTAVLSHGAAGDCFVAADACGQHAERAWRARRRASSCRHVARAPAAVRSCCAGGGPRMHNARTVGLCRAVMADSTRGARWRRAAVHSRLGNLSCTRSGRDACPSSATAAPLADRARTVTTAETHECPALQILNSA